MEKNKIGLETFKKSEEKFHTFSECLKNRDLDAEAEKDEKLTSEAIENKYQKFKESFQFILKVYLDEWDTVAEIKQDQMHKVVGIFEEERRLFLYDVGGIGNLTDEQKYGLYINNLSYEARGNRRIAEVQDILQNRFKMEESMVLPRLQAMMYITLNIKYDSALDENNIFRVAYDLLNFIERAIRGISTITQKDLIIKINLSEIFFQYNSELLGKAISWISGNKLTKNEENNVLPRMEKWNKLYEPKIKEMKALLEKMKLEERERAEARLQEMTPEEIQKLLESFAKKKESNFSLLDQ